MRRPQLPRPRRQPPLPPAARPRRATNPCPAPPAALPARSSHAAKRAGQDPVRAPDAPPVRRPGPARDAARTREDRPCTTRARPPSRRPNDTLPGSQPARPPRHIRMPAAGPHPIHRMPRRPPGTKTPAPRARQAATTRPPAVDPPTDVRWTEIAEASARCPCRITIDGELNPAPGLPRVGPFWAAPDQITANSPGAFDRVITRPAVNPSVIN